MFQLKLVSGSAYADWGNGQIANLQAAAFQVFGITEKSAQQCQAEGLESMFSAHC